MTTLTPHTTATVHPLMSGMTTTLVMTPTMVSLKQAVVTVQILAGIIDGTTVNILMNTDIAEKDPPSQVGCVTCHVLHFVLLLLLLL